jgi:cell division septum initiation protein DivIVA
MSNTTQIDQIAERIERLLVRHEELQRTNVLLSAQVDSLTAERDSLKSRLGAARARVDNASTNGSAGGNSSGGNHGHGQDSHAVADSHKTTS